MSKELEPKDCEACGVQYTPYRSSQKYCPDCTAKGGIRQLRKYEHHIAASKQYEQFYTPTLHTNTCIICNKEFQSIYQKDVCSDKCNIIKRKNKLICIQCGKPLIEAYAERGLEVPDMEVYNRLHFCCKECYTEYQLTKYPTRICENCGKPYNNSNKSFCCQKCKFEYMETHGQLKPAKPQTTQTKQNTHKPVYTCFICKKTYTKPAHFRNDYSNKKAGYLPLCSDKCLSVYEKHAADYADKEHQKKLSDYIKANGMCGICDVPYKDCERMQSNFRIIPKGAKYIDSKIQVCPKFKTHFK